VRGTDRTSNSELLISGLTRVERATPVAPTTFKVPGLHCQIAILPKRRIRLPWAVQWEPTSTFPVWIHFKLNTVPIAWSASESSNENYMGSSYRLTRPNGTRTMRKSMGWWNTRNLAVGRWLMRHMTFRFKFASRVSGLGVPNAGKKDLQEWPERRKGSPAMKENLPGRRSIRVGERQWY